MQEKRNTVIIIAGPTASGKTALALELARHYNTSIISADSRQCFKELDIGVAKPTEEELRSIKHYFISSHSIHDDVSAQTFETYALRAADEIFQNRPVAIMAGGTGLYIKAFCEGLDAVPPPDPAVRQQVTLGYEAGGLEWLQQQVQHNDPEFWQTAEQQNPRRLMRALEVLLTTGKSITTYKTQIKKERPFHIYKAGIDVQVDILKERIDARVDQMMEEGLLTEVAGLQDFKSINALQTVGYRELFAFLDGEFSLDEAVNRIKDNTRQYARRQRTWFKKDAEINWNTPDELFNSVISTIPVVV